MPQPTAAILAIGDELLSGRTRDANIHYLAGWLGERDVALKEARIVADDQDAIVAAVNVLRARWDYLFTSGGIGPTHDDITVDAIAAAFGAPVVEHPEAIAMIERWYGGRGEEVTPARRRMARVPEGARLLRNPVTGAPGVAVGNVFVLAGVPSIFQAMLGAVEPLVAGGARVHSRAVTAAGLAESRLADALARIAADHPQASVGSYPIDGDEKGVTIVARSESAAEAQAVVDAAAAEMRRLGAAPAFEDRKAEKKKG